MHIKELTLIGIMTAITCIIGPFAIITPFSPIPVSLTSFIIFLSVYLLGARYGTTSYLIYLLIGLAGLPVFSGFTSGPGHLFGPTGGYLIGFIFMAYISGIMIEKWPLQKWLSLIGMLLGTIICYLLGTVWFAFQSNLTFSAAFVTGVCPFLPGDLIKIGLVMAIGPKLRLTLTKAGLC